MINAFHIYSENIYHFQCNSDLGYDHPTFLLTSTLSPQTSCQRVGLGLVSKCEIIEYPLNTCDVFKFANVEILYCSRSELGFLESSSLTNF